MDSFTVDSGANDTRKLMSEGDAYHLRHQYQFQRRREEQFAECPLSFGLIWVSLGARRLSR